MRLLVVLHENPVGYHDDWRGALSALRSRGALEDYTIVPFRALQATGASVPDVEGEIIAKAADLRATAVLWCHTSRLEVGGATLSRLQTMSGRPVFGYWEGDMYQWPHKPFPKPARQIARACDVVFVPGYSSFSDSLRRAGCSDLRYAPSPTDEARFGEAFGLRRSTPEFDVVMIGNRVTSRAPLKTMPGARQRMRLVQLFEKKLGNRFAVFGSGWKGQSAQGPISFVDQGKAYAAGHVALGNNNIHAACYFSDRLPIAMSCGSIVVHCHEAGFDDVFGHDHPLWLYHDAHQAWLAARRLLETPDADLQASRLRGRDLALGRFTMLHVLDYIVAVMAEVSRRNGQRSGVSVTTNPWISGDELPAARRVQRTSFAARVS
jgi:hypothetical protein